MGDLGLSALSQIKQFRKLNESIVLKINLQTTIISFYVMSVMSVMLVMSGTFLKNFEIVAKRHLRKFV